jgi:hypothetical protein
MTAQSPELSAFLNYVLKSADAAATCCDSILDLQPLARERYATCQTMALLCLLSVACIWCMRVTHVQTIQR